MNMREVFWKSKEIIPQINYIRQLKEDKFIAVDEKKLSYILIASGDDLEIIEEAS